MIKAFPPLVFAESTILILGTMPGEKSLQLQEYYGNKANQFWKLLYAVYEEVPSDDYNEKVKFLKRMGIALWDVLEFCERKGSLDSAIKCEVPNDFDTFYNNHPAIRQVFFSSKNAEKFYDKHVKKRSGIIYRTLPSPSGANATMRFSEKLEIWKNILKE